MLIKKEAQMLRISLKKTKNTIAQNIFQKHVKTWSKTLKIYTNIKKQRLLHIGITTSPLKIFIVDNFKVDKRTIIAMFE